WKTFNYAQANQSKFDRDQASGHAIQETLAQDARVYQLPYISFPEVAPRFNEGSYGLLRRYLHTHGISWSYGAMRGRESDQWIRKIESFAMPKRLATLAASDFDAVLIERAAYTDGGEAIETEISNLIGPPTLICPDMSCSLFRLEPSNDSIASPLLLVVRGSGFRSWTRNEDGRDMTESAGDQPSRLFLLNPLKRREVARLGFTISSSSDAMLLAKTDRLTFPRLQLRAGREESFAGTIELDPGITTLILSATPTGTNDSGPRNSNFVLSGVRIDPIDAPEIDQDLRKTDAGSDTIFSSKERQ
ncbi:MAG: hypothetical protein ABIR27_10750, partial [Dokdonella sp.]